MKTKFGFMILALVIILTGCSSSQSIVKSNNPSPIPVKKYDLVLVHGLANVHHWSNEFLDVCLQNWGSGNVYVVYMNKDPKYRSTISKKIINGREVICCGEESRLAGDDYIDIQAEALSDEIKLLQEKAGLDQKFEMIGHSMGGLIARYYIYQNPNTVTGLVTLGTPHHGSPLARGCGWMFGPVIGGRDAVEHLESDYLVEFNRRFPIASAPLADEGRVYTIRGDASGVGSFGWAGELGLGWWVMKVFTFSDSDGLVPPSSAVIDGAEHVADFENYNHYNLVQMPDVAMTASRYLR